MRLPLIRKISNIRAKQALNVIIPWTVTTFLFRRHRQRRRVSNDSLTSTDSGSLETP
jgi:hypothetical protein